MTRLPITSNRPLMLPILAALIALFIFSPAHAGSGVGIRFGYSDVPDEVFKGSGDLGGTNLVGLHLALKLLPLLDLEIAGEYTKEEFGFREGLFEGIEAGGKGDYEDMTLYATARWQVFTLLLLPMNIYIGGGLNSHWVDLQFDETPVEYKTPQPADGDLEDAIKKVAGERSEVGWHAVGGAKLAFPQSPLSIFVEARYLKGMSDDVPSSRSIYGGFTIEL